MASPKTQCTTRMELNKCPQMPHSDLSFARIGANLLAMPTTSENLNHDLTIKH